MLVLYFSLSSFQHDDNGVKKGSHDEGLDKILLMFYDMKRQKLFLAYSCYDSI